MEGKVFSVSGQELRTIDMSDNVFGLPINEDVIWYAVNNELANARVGTADTKTRKEVHGTGRARHGDVKSPIFVGGGTIFGPHPRDYSYSINKKAKRLAMKSILSLKAQNNSMKIVEDFSVESAKTRDISAILDKLLPSGKRERTVVILKDDDSLIKRAGRNIPWLHFLTFNRLRAHDLFYGRNVIVMESAVSGLNDFYGEE